MFEFPEMIENTKILQLSKDIEMCWQNSLRAALEIKAAYGRPEWKS
jgi:hypothetical protein